MDALVLTPAIAEVFLALAAIGLVLVAAFGGDPDKTASLMRRLSVGVLLITGLLTNTYGAAPDLAFGHMFITSPFTVYMKLLVLIGAIVVVIVSKPHLRADGIHKPEFYLLILLSVLGMMVVISANDLMVLYMGVELQSLPLYVVAAMQRDQLRSSEAGLKYFLLGALSSGLVALRCIADLRFCRCNRLCRDRFGTLERCFCRCCDWCCFPDRRSRLQDIRGTFPYVDTGCV